MIDMHKERNMKVRVMDKGYKIGEFGINGNIKDVIREHFESGKASIIEHIDGDENKFKLFNLSCPLYLEVDILT